MYGSRSARAEPRADSRVHRDARCRYDRDRTADRGVRSLDEFFLPPVEPGRDRSIPIPITCCRRAMGGLSPGNASAMATSWSRRRARRSGTLMVTRARAEFANPAVLLVRLGGRRLSPVSFSGRRRRPAPRAVGSRLHSVHPIALDAGAPSFANYRVCTRIESDRFGPLLIIEVVGADRGTRSVQTFAPARVDARPGKEPLPFRRSALLMLGAGEAESQFDEDLIVHRRRVESQVRVGTRVAVSGDDASAASQFRWANLLTYLAVGTAARSASCSPMARRRASGPGRHRAGHRRSISSRPVRPALFRAPDDEQRVGVEIDSLADVISFGWRRPCVSAGGSCR